MTRAKVSLLVLGLMALFLLPISSATAQTEIVEDPEPQPLRLTVGDIQRIVSTEAIDQILVADPGVVRVVPIDPVTISLSGVGPGTTTINITDGSNEISAYRIEVEPTEVKVGETSSSSASSSDFQRLEARIDALEAKLDAILKAIESLKSDR